MTEPKLEQLRARIDALDEQIQVLLTERASCAKQIAEVKQDGGGEADFYRPEREAEVLRRVREHLEAVAKVDREPSRELEGRDLTMVLRPAKRPQVGQQVAAAE